MANSQSSIKLRMAKATSQTEQMPGTMSIVIKRQYAHLEKELRRAFSQQSVNIVVDRRFGQRRSSEKCVDNERRRKDRRRPQEAFIEAIIWI